MSTVRTAQILRDSKSTLLDRLVLLAISDLGEQRICDLDDIASWTNSTTNAVALSVRNLQALGEIEASFDESTGWWIDITLGQPARSFHLASKTLLSRLFVRDEAGRLDLDVAFHVYVREIERLNWSEHWDEGCFKANIWEIAEDLGYRIEDLMGRRSIKGLRVANSVEFLDEESAGTWMTIRAMVIDRDGTTCRYCGLPSENPHVDHIVPRSRGGNNSLSNLCVACPKCNSCKGDRLIEEMDGKWWWQREAPETEAEHETVINGEPQLNPTGGVQ